MLHHLTQHLNIARVEIRMQGSALLQRRSDGNFSETVSFFSLVYRLA
jgi:hypothetical protein